MSSRDSIEKNRTPEQMAAAKAELEGMSTPALFAVTLEGEYEDDLAWEAVSVLRTRGTAAVFEWAKRYCESDDPKARARGLSILAQLGAGKPDAERPFMDESVSIAIRHLHDSNPEVVSSAAWALSHLGTNDAVTALIELPKHADPEVRQAVACCFGLMKRPEWAPILLGLMEDESEVVRDWATFELGSGALVAADQMHYADSAEIREALRRRTQDSYEDARREAIWGLAKRKDHQGLTLLLEQLESDSWWSGDEDAAQEILSVNRDTPVEELRQGLRRLLS